MNDRGGEGRYSLMYVDDDPQVLELFRRFFSKEYRVFTATTGSEALGVLSREPVHVLFADQRMPAMSGIQLLETVARDHPDTARVLVTGYADIDVVIDAINRGSVYRYLSKPWEFEELAGTVRNALEVHSLKRHNQELIASLDEQNRLLLRTVEELRFLNQLDLDLKAAGDADAVLRRTIDRLTHELGARDGWCWETGAEALNLRIPPQDPTRLSRLQDTVKRSVLAATEGPQLFPLENRASLCVLPLYFADIRFGVLVFAFEETQPLDPSELMFMQAVSHVASSVLYSHYVHAQELKRESLMMLGQMSSMIVHDLKGPLATILGFVSLLQADLPAAQRAEFGAIINQEVTRLIEMVEELLSFSRGQPNLRLTQFEVGSLVREVLELFHLSFQKDRIAVEVETGAEHVVRADRQKLKKVLINLLENARDYLREVEAERTISIRSIQEDRHLKIAVANSGPPLPVEVAGRVFDPFYSYKKEEGTGLGLTICKRIVEEHGGTLEVQCERGLTEFITRLPTGSGVDPES
ncbi:MAG: hybrid sensor histidine kinase/response regulator [Spirochaetales bacterium]|nr:hybrid sensor histidine kinase/response regulator [Spirochaetales bacterium]